MKFLKAVDIVGNEPVFETGGRKPDVFINSDVDCIPLLPLSESQNPIPL
jgi:hypothetical protein